MISTLSTTQLRQRNVDRKTFRELPRRPIHVILDRVQRGYNIGAIMRLCDAFLIEHMTICGVEFDIKNKRRVVAAAQGSQKWTPHSQADNAVSVIKRAKLDGYQIVVGDLTDESIRPEEFEPKFPICLILGSESSGISHEVLELADVAISIPMYGMANSLNVSTAAAILLYQLTCKIG